MVLLKMHLVLSLNITNCTLTDGGHSNLVLSGGQWGKGHRFFAMPSSCNTSADILHRLRTNSPKMSLSRNYRTNLSLKRRSMLTISHVRLPFLKTILEVRLLTAPI
jgi:hypothetical protein